MPRSIPSNPNLERILLVAVIVILELAGSHIPFADTLTILLVPVPVALGYLRHGPLTSILTAVAAGLTLAPVFGCHGATDTVVHVGTTGITMGFCLRRRISAGATVLAVVLVGMASTAFSAIGVAVSV